MKGKVISVHIADDHQILIDGIKAVLKTEEQIDVVGYSLDGISVINWFSRYIGVRYWNAENGWH
jgi:DNA-binding NarL/FixJ family response regulator